MDKRRSLVVISAICSLVTILTFSSMIAAAANMKQIGTIFLYTLIVGIGGFMALGWVWGAVHIRKQFFLLYRDKEGRLGYVGKNTLYVYEPKSLQFVSSQHPIPNIPFALPQDETSRSSQRTQFQRESITPVTRTREGELRHLIQKVRGGFITDYKSIRVIGYDLKAVAKNPNIHIPDAARIGDRFLQLANEIEKDLTIVKGPQTDMLQHDDIRQMSHVAE